MPGDEVKTRLVVEGDEALAMLARITQAERGHAGSVKETGDAATGVSQKLRDLIAQELAYKDALNQGQQETAEQAAAAAQRRAQIEQLSQTIARQQDMEARVNATMRQSITTHRELDGAGRRLADVKREEEEATRRQEDAERQAEQAKRRSRAATDEQTAAKRTWLSVLNSAKSSVLGLVTGLIGAGGLMMAMRQVRQEMEENTRAIQEYAEANLDLQFLSSTFNAQEREFVGKAAMFAGRRPSEAAGAYAQLKSFFPGKSDQELQQLFMEISETARTTPADMGTLTEAFTGIYAETNDAQLAQNILRSTIIQAGKSDPATISRVLGKFLAPGQQVGGLSPAQAAGFVAAATGLDTRSAEEQVTGLRTVMLALMGNMTEEQMAIAQAAGIDTSNFGTALNTLGRAIERGDLSNADLDVLIGAEGIATATAFGNPQKRREFFQKVNEVAKSAMSGRDLTGEAITEQFKHDRAGLINLRSKQADAELFLLKASDTAAGEAELGAKLLDIEERRAGRSTLNRSVDQGFYYVGSALGDLFGGDPAIWGGALVNIGELSFKQSTPEVANVSQQLDAVREGKVINVFNGPVVTGQNPLTDDRHTEPRR